MDAILDSFSEKTNKNNSALETVVCDLCGASGFSVVFSVNWYPDDIACSQSVVRCGSCGLMYTNPRPDRTLITRLYQKYYVSGTDSGDVASTKTFIRRHPLLRRLWHAYCGQYLGYVLKRAKGRVLDIGCGRGGLLEELSDNGCESYGVELNPDSVEICRKKGLNVKVGSIDDLDFEEGFFDTVILWHVIEHVPFPMKALEKIKKILKPGGSVFLFLPNASSYFAALFGISWVNWHIPFHFYHFTPDTFRRVARKSEFDIVRLKTATPEYYFPYSYDAWFKYRFHTKKSWQFVRKIICAFYFRVAISPVLRLLDVVFHGKGECLQVELQKPVP
jgi:2-polyprenyl-3-methyl-5-hydroxy-6-metoxy-1,4-benzoquinol methylase